VHVPPPESGASRGLSVRRSGGCRAR
jgi:hypothetical protein